MFSAFLARLLSRKFLLALAAIAYLAVQASGGVISPHDAEDAIVKLVLGYLTTEGLADVVTRYVTPELPAPAIPLPPPAAPVAPVLGA